MGVKVYHRIEELRAALTQIRSEGCPIGLVPTMGALHCGHISLVTQSVQDQQPENGITVVSIFVNPIQFENQSDLERYPQTLDADLALCEEAGADIVFAPTAGEIYPQGFSTYVDMEDDCLNVLCGRARPGHFRGVLTVVSKLFHIVEPTRAYFGEKDAQQLFVLKKMARDLNMGISVIGCPTVREEDGLALSSRNTRLSAEERTAALCLVRTLNEGRIKLEDRGRALRERISAEFIASVKHFMIETIEREPLARIDYADILDAETLGAVTNTTRKAMLAAAAFFGTTRLIDNMNADVGNRDEETV